MITHESPLESGDISGNPLDSGDPEYPLEYRDISGNTKYPSYPLEYGDISGSYKNILFIDNAIDDLETIINSINLDTFYIVYSGCSSILDVSNLLQILPMDTIDRIGFFFTLSGNSKIFLDRKPFYDPSMNYAESDEIPSDANFDFIVYIINKYNIEYIDYLACNTLSFERWNNYYNALMQKTNVIVGASDNETGNIKYGGDWILETTGEDIELIYFNKSIQYYKYLLDNLTWVSGLTAGVFDIDVYDGNLYASVNQVNGYLIKVNTTTAAVTLNWSPILNSPFRVVIIPPYIYTGLQSTAQIFQLNLSNGTIVTSTWVTSGSYVGAGAIYTFGGQYMYILRTDLTPQRIQIANLSTGAIVNNNWFSNRSFTYITHIVYNNGFLYVSAYTEPNVSYILKMNPTTAAYTIFTSGLNSCVGCTITNNYVYAINISNGTISQISSTSGTIINATWKTGLNTPLTITNDGTYLYIGNLNGTISQIDIPLPPINIGNNPTGIKYKSGTTFIDICNNFSSINLVTIPTFNGQNFSTGIFCYYNSSKYDLAQLYKLNTSITANPAISTNIYTKYINVSYDINSFFNSNSGVVSGSYTILGNSSSSISGSKNIYTFTSLSGTLTMTVNQSILVTILCVGGGGGGGWDGGGGGGGGGVYNNTLTLAAGTYTITIGGGGAAANTSTAIGSNGGNSSFIGGSVNIICYGGGGGGNNHNTSPAGNGGNGGGRGAKGLPNVSGTFGSGISGQGNNGGDSLNNLGGGGGGYSAAGSVGNGGNGILSSITGTNTWYGGGGGGGTWDSLTGGTGGLGGGGNGGTGGSNNISGQNASFYGGGGGGSGNAGGTIAGNGYQGICIISI